MKKAWKLVVSPLLAAAVMAPCPSPRWRHVYTVTEDEVQGYTANITKE